MIEFIVVLSDSLINFKITIPELQIKCIIAFMWQSGSKKGLTEKELWVTIIFMTISNISMLK